MYSGFASGTSGVPAFCYFRVFDVNLHIPADTTLSYWIYPQNDLGRYVSIDFLCTDGTELRNSGCVDQNGVNVHPVYGHGSTIQLNNTWS